MESRRVRTRTIRARRDALLPVPANTPQFAREGAFFTKHNTRTIPVINLDWDKIAL